MKNTETAYREYLEKNKQIPNLRNLMAILNITRRSPLAQEIALLSY